MRPRTRGDCVSGPRPCPWVGCKYHLALDLLTDGGLASPLLRHVVCNVRGYWTMAAPRHAHRRATGQQIERWEDELVDRLDSLPYTCALDVAGDLGGVRLQDIADILGVTRERIRQIESVALRKLQAQRMISDISDLAIIDDYAPKIGDTRYCEICGAMFRMASSSQRICKRPACRLARRRRADNRRRNGNPNPDQG